MWSKRAKWGSKETKTEKEQIPIQVCVIRFLLWQLGLNFNCTAWDACRTSIKCSNIQWREGRNVHLLVTFPTEWLLSTDLSGLCHLNALRRKQKNIQCELKVGLCQSKVSYTKLYSVTTTKIRGVPRGCAIGHQSIIYIFVVERLKQWEFGGVYAGEIYQPKKKRFTDIL